LLEVGELAHGAEREFAERWGGIDEGVGEWALSDWVAFHV
jgi:hypothetical protein